MAEKEGFEPSIELQTLYSLSRGAPSASRPPLRIYCIKQNNYRQLCSRCLKHVYGVSAPSMAVYNKALENYVKHFFKRKKPFAVVLVNLSYFAVLRFCCFAVNSAKNLPRIPTAQLFSPFKPHYLASALQHRQ